MPGKKKTALRPRKTPKVSKGRYLYILKSQFPQHGVQIGLSKNPTARIRKYKRMICWMDYELLTQVSGCSIADLKWICKTLMDQPGVNVTVHSPTVVWVKPPL
jgi:hypothetical protein